jgi:hypothetical protein
MIGLAQCGGDVEPTLPPITQEGRNTIGFKVNGKVWVPEVKSGWSPTPLEKLCTDLYGDANTFYIDANRFIVGSEPTNGLFFKIENLNSTGEYFGTTNLVMLRYSYGEKGYSPILDKPAELKITKLDTENKIISGTFYFTATEDITGEVVTITDGRFDIKYRYCE